jgi:hypothetical protein
VVTGIPLVTLGWLTTVRLRRRRDRRRMGWAELQLERLERAGARRGRSRRAWEGPRRYADILARSVLPDDRLRTVAALIESDAWSGAQPSDAQRRQAEELFELIETAHPAPR